MELIPANDNNPLGNVYDLEQAAVLLKQTPRTVSKIAKQHGLCSYFGRDLFFSDSDILAIWDAKRWPSSSSSETTSITSVAPSEEQVFTRLRERLTKTQRKKSVSSVKLNS